MSAPAGAAPGRLWEIDLARTLAIAMMVAYHVGYDVHMLAPSVDLDPFTGGWRALQVATGSSFLGIVGVSFAVSNARARARGLAGWALWRKHARRAGVVLAAAAVVSVATRIALGGDDWVRFGVLHAIGVSVLLAPALVRLGVWNLPLAAGVIAAGLALRDERVDHPWLLPLGVRPAEVGVDYYPLLPWLGAVMIGLAVGRLLYPGGRRGAWAGRLPAEPRLAAPAGAPGRHALGVYLVHQPVLIALVAGLLTLAGVTVDPDGVG